VNAVVKTWFDLVDELRAEQGMSLDTLAYEARSHGAPSTFVGSWLSQLRRGTRPMAPDILRGIAGALDVEPEAFAEYRLAMARRQLDEREVGLDQAATNLTQLGAMVGAGGLPGPPDGELAQILKAASPNSKDRTPQHSTDPSKAARRKPAA
jgi:transcriptional regulator with XRE-family HTH domain